MGWLARLFALKKKCPKPDLATYERARSRAQSLARPCWKPLVEAGDSPLDASKFGGTPWLSKHEPWPLCGCCGEPLQLFVQLNAGTLPAEAKAGFAGLLQLFYCSSFDCDPALEDWNPGGRNQLVRIVSPSGDPAMQSFTGKNPFVPKRIVGWRMQEDFPSWWELPSDWPSDEADAFSHPKPEWNKPRYSDDGDKLWGWPFWVQDVSYIDCPDCGKPMRFLFQIASEDNVDYMFGDSGIGHISYCSDHPHRTAFYWSCY